MTVVVWHIGQRGDKGAAGADGVDSLDIRGGFLDAPFLTLFNPNAISSAISWARGNEGTYTDRYGDQKRVAGDDIIHVLRDTNDFGSANWFDLDGTWTLDTTNETDPFGGSNASQITLGNTTSTTTGMFGEASITTGAVYRVSYYAKLISGTITGMEVQIGGAGTTFFDVDGTIDGTWQRFDVLIAAENNAVRFNLIFRTTGAVIHLYQCNITQGTILHDPYTNGATIPTTVASGVDPWREAYGYFIGGGKTNLCPQSQAVRFWNLSGGATVTVNTGADMYGDTNTYTLVNMNGSTSVSLSQDVTLTDGATYTVSFWAVADNQTVENLSFSLGGGDLQTVSVTDTYERQSYQVTAGSQDTITFNAVASGSDVKFILTGVQVEEGDLSAYIPTGSAAQTSDVDIVTMTGSQVPNLQNEWSIGLAWGEIPNTTDQKTLIDDNNNELLVYITGQTLTVCGTNFDIALDALDVFLVYDGADISVYQDEVLLGTVTQAFTLPTTVYIGSDSSGSNPFNGYIDFFNWYDFALTYDEIRFISEYTIYGDDSNSD